MSTLTAMSGGDTSLVSRNHAALQSLRDALRDTTNSDTLRSLVVQSLSHEAVYAGFDELKSLILSIHSSVDERVIQTLDLFSYGVYSDYVQEKTKFLPLTNAQVSKLRQLTVVNVLAATTSSSTSVVPYAALLGPVELPDGRSLEQQVLLPGLYAGLWQGRLCQATQSWLHPVLAGVRDVPEQNTIKAEWVALWQRLDQAHASTQTSVNQIQMCLEQARTDLKDVQLVVPVDGSSAVASANSRRQKRGRGGMMQLHFKT